MIPIKRKTELSAYSLSKVLNEIFQLVPNPTFCSMAKPDPASRMENL